MPRTGQRRSGLSFACVLTLDLTSWLRDVVYDKYTRPAGATPGKCVGTNFPSLTTNQLSNPLWPSWLRRPTVRNNVIGRSTVRSCPGEFLFVISRFLHDRKQSGFATGSCFLLFCLLEKCNCLLPVHGTVRTPNSKLSSGKINPDPVLHRLCIPSNM